MPLSETQIIPSVQVLNTAMGATNGSIIVQYGDVTSEDTEGFEAQLVQQPGLISLPPNAVPGGTAAECTIIKTEYRDFAIAMRDVNTQAQYGMIGPGETCIYGVGANGTSQGRIICKNNSSVTMATTDTGDTSGNAVYFQVSPTSMQFVAPWGTMVFDKSGFHVLTAAGASFSLGGVPLLPPGLSAVIPSLCSINAGTLTLGAPFINLGDGVNAPYLSSGILPMTFMSTTSIMMGSPSVLIGNPVDGGTVITLTGVTAITGATSIIGNTTMTGNTLISGNCAVAGTLSENGVPIVAP